MTWGPVSTPPIPCMAGNDQFGHHFGLLPSLHKLVGRHGCQGGIRGAPEPRVGLTWTEAQPQAPPTPCWGISGQCANHIQLPCTWVGGRWENRLPREVIVSSAARMGHGMGARRRWSSLSLQVQY